MQCKPLAALIENDQLWPAMEAPCFLMFNRLTMWLSEDPAGVDRPLVCLLCCLQASRCQSHRGHNAQCGRAGREDESGDVSQETERTQQIMLLSHYQFYFLDPNLLIPLFFLLLLFLFLTSPLLCLPVRGPRISLRPVPHERVLASRVHHWCRASRVEGLDRIWSHRCERKVEPSPFPWRPSLLTSPLHRVFFWFFLYLIDFHLLPHSSSLAPSSMHRCSRSRRDWWRLWASHSLVPVFKVLKKKIWLLFQGVYSNDYWLFQPHSPEQEAAAAVAFLSSFFNPCLLVSVTNRCLSTITYPYFLFLFFASYKVSQIRRTSLTKGKQKDK